jgi:hypothetical protein
MIDAKIDEAIPPLLILITLQDLKSVVILRAAPFAARRISTYSVGSIHRLRSFGAEKTRASG